MQFGNKEDTICALSTAPGIGALALIRISGPAAFTAFQSVFSRDIQSAATHTVHFGSISRKERDAEVLIDEVVAAVFRAPRSFTGEDTVEITCHGSTYVQAQILQLLLAAGCRMAQPGEFSLRAFANGKVDLSQAEAIADLIASTSAGAHKLAMNQMRGGFSKKIASLREGLINFASLIELELDFSEEDVEFADRQALTEMVVSIQRTVTALIDSFAAGHAIKNGIPVAILGAPNMGKSTLLNALLDEDKAIVSEIAGTTRDIIEDEMTIDGIRFRFIDTAGLRDTTDVVENIGISRAMERAGRSAVILYLFDAVESSATAVQTEIHELSGKIGIDPFIIPIANKIDKARDVAELKAHYAPLPGTVLISAANGTGMDELRRRLLEVTGSLNSSQSDVIVSNLRHYEALTKANEALAAVLEGITNGVTGDFLAMDIRRALFHLGEITGEITTEDLLGNIFSKFCIGK
jgi:tRNA modification GTPase